MEANIIEKPAYISREEKRGITQDILKEYFDYKDGFLYWKKIYSTNKKAYIGDRAGYLHINVARFKINFKGYGYVSSRFIFCWHLGYWPKEVDHKDRNSLNDKIENLRESTRAENNRNTCSRKNSSSIYLGVSFKIKKWKHISKVDGKIYIYEKPCWMARIQFDKKQKEIGIFKTEKEAALAYNKAAVKYFGEFANLNIIKP